MQNHIMIDTETLSTSNNAMVLSIGAVRFDPCANELEKPQFKKFYYKINLDSCTSLNLDIDDSTIEWWSRQSKSAQEEAFSSANRMDIYEVFEQLHKFCLGAKYFWSNGAGFDLIICENIFRKMHRACPWYYWQARDVRTMFDLGIDPFKPPVTIHHALEDATNQAIGVQSVTRRLKELGINPFDK